MTDFPQHLLVIGNRDIQVPRDFDVATFLPVDPETSFIFEDGKCRNHSVAVFCEFQKQQKIPK
jgi:hypothetical protein